MLVSYAAPTMAVLPSPEMATLQPKREAPPAPFGTILLPNWVYCAWAQGIRVQAIRRASLGEELIGREYAEKLRDSSSIRVLLGQLEEVLRRVPAAVPGAGLVEGR